MNKKRGSCAAIAFLVVACASAILVAIIFAYLYGPKWLDQKRALASPPTVIVDAPSEGDTASEGDILTASATATGQNPIARVELWLDGELYRQQIRDSSLAQGLTTFPANFSIEMTEGTHMLYWRAIDSVGLVGQSSPITINGTPRMGGGETTVETTNEGQNLQDMAEELGVDPDVLVDLNPGLGTGGLPGGTNVTVPKIPPQGTSGNQPTPGGGAPTDLNQPKPPPELPPGTLELLPLSPIAVNPISVIMGLLDQLPAAPSSLRAGWENCTVELQWYDNAVNEESYTVWMQAGSNPPTNIATLGQRRDTGPARYRFKSPAFGIYRFWVEAKNILGSQPSEVEWLFINDPTCQEALATRLEIEALDLTYDGNGKFYCYVSLEGIPEKRIPEDDSEFIELRENPAGTEWDITKYWGGEKRILVPIP
ncbi:MAG: Ig-like domain-containing protein, partial [Anaerolineales bacterium]|nr:Ig-like domain-containing protein [Anaerolineales bacterium]